MAAPPPTLPAPAALRGAPDVLVARPALGLTLYLAQPAVWAREGAAAMFQAFLARAPAGRLTWYTTSQIPDWHRVDAARLSEISRALSPWLGKPRHLLQLKVVDDTGAPSVGFVYREIDERIARRAATLEIVFSPDSDPGVLLQLATEAASRFPVLCGVAGHAATWNPHEKPTAFWEIHGWCKRHLGLDVQDPDAMAWQVLDGLPGTSWITVIGNSLADRLKIDLAALAAGPWKHGVTGAALAHGLILQAGPAPVLGDLNRDEFPWVYAEVARRLAPWFVKEPSPYWGGFYEKEDTLAWLRRLVEPEGWQ